MVVNGTSRTSLDLRGFFAESRIDPMPTEPVLVCGVLLTELQYSALTDPRFEALANEISAQNLRMEMEGEGILWIVQPYGFMGIDLRWTPDEPGWRVSTGSGREFFAQDFPSALKLAFTIVDRRRQSPEEKMLRSIFQRPKAYDR